MTATKPNDVESLEDRDVGVHCIVGSRVFVAVRSSDIRGCVETRVLPSFNAAILWCYYTYRLHRPAWEPFLTKYAPNGPLTISEGGKVRRARYVGWQQEMKDGSMMQIFEQEVRSENGH